MKIAVIYDSKYGNTSKVAAAMVGALNGTHETHLLLAEVATGADLHETDIVIVGSPTQGGRPSQHIQSFLEALPSGILKNVKVAAFDTRFAIDEHGKALELLMKNMGFAAPDIAEGLKAKGGVQVVEPEGFIVRDKDGPMKEGEIDRAIKWVKKIIAS